MSVKIIDYRCPQNHRCPAVMVCPTKALSQSGEAAPVVEDDKCVDCGKCVWYCPTGAIAMNRA